MLVNSYQQLSRFSTNKIRYILCSDEHSQGEHKHLNYIQVYVLHILEKNPSGCSICYIRVITKLPNSEQSYKGKAKTHKYIKRQNQSTTGKL